MNPTATETTPAFTAEAIADRVQQLAHDIRVDAGSGEVFLLGILKGASVFTADLLRAMSGDVSYSFIDVIRDAADNETADAIEIDFLSFTDIRGRNVYVIKDVVATGVIENYLLAQLRMHGPAKLRLVALLDRFDARTVDIKADFCGFTCEEGAYFGYGLERGGRLGNLPWIGRA